MTPITGERIVKGRRLKTEAEGKVRKTYTPLGAAVAVQQLCQQNETAGGIALADGSGGDSAYMPTPVCRVIAVGPDVKELKPGMLVLVHDRTPLTVVSHPDVTNQTLMTEEKNVLGIVDEADGEGRKWDEAARRFNHAT